jgi:hypothetical protein
MPLVMSWVTNAVQQTQAEAVLAIGDIYVV